MFSLDIRANALAVWNLIEDMMVISDDVEIFSHDVENAIAEVLSKPGFMQAMQETMPDLYEKMAALLQNPTTKKWQWNVQCSCQLMFEHRASTKRAGCRTCMRSSIDVVNEAFIKRGLNPLRLVSSSSSKSKSSSTATLLSHSLPSNEVVLLEGGGCSGEPDKVYELVECRPPSQDGTEKHETVAMRRLQGVGEDHINCRHCYFCNASLPQAVGEDAWDVAPFLGKSTVNVSHNRTTPFFAQQLVLSLGSIFFCGKCRPHWAILSRGFVLGFIKRSLLVPTNPMDVTMECTFDTPMLTPDGQYQLYSTRSNRPIVRKPTDAVLPENAAMFGRRGDRNSDISTVPMSDPFVYLNNVESSKAPEFRMEKMEVIDSRLYTGPIMAKFVHDVRCLIGLDNFEAKKHNNKDSGRKYAPHMRMITCLQRRQLTMKSSVPHAFAVLISLAVGINVPEELYPDDYLPQNEEDASRSYTASARDFARQTMADQKGKVSDEASDYLRRFEATLILMEEENCPVDSSAASETMGSKRRAIRAFAESVTRIGAVSPDYESIVSFVWPIPKGCGELRHFIEGEFEWHREFSNVEILFHRLLRSNHDDALGVGAIALIDAMNLAQSYDEIIAANGGPRLSSGRPIPMPNDWMDQYYFLTSRYYSALLIGT